MKARKRVYLVCDLGLSGLAICFNSNHFEAVFGGVPRGLVILLHKTINILHVYLSRGRSTYLAVQGNNLGMACTC